MGSQRVGHNWVNEQQQQSRILPCFKDIPLNIFLWRASEISKYLRKSLEPTLRSSTILILTILLLVCMSSKWSLAFVFVRNKYSCWACQISSSWRSNKLKWWIEDIQDASLASQVAQTVKSPPAMQETRVWSLGREDLQEKGMATHSSILAWRIS